MTVSNEPPTSTTDEPPDWWSEEGERWEARDLACRIRHFISDSRLLGRNERQSLESAQLTLEAHSDV